MKTLPDFGAASFSDGATVTNPLFPLPGGMINSYAAEALDEETGEVETERNDHFATFATRTIGGIDSVVVRDTAFGDGVLVEDTLDWYAQDDDGNVWYMGEIAVNYNYDEDEGDFTHTDFGGSWEAGVDGAKPGWIMLADPQVGDSYFQEFYEGTAEDAGEVIATGLTVETPLGRFDDVVQILDTAPLEPLNGAFKFYAPGVGMVQESEILIAEPDDPQLVVNLDNLRSVDMSGAVDPSELGFAGDGERMTVTFLSEDSEENGAIGAYTYDSKTGEIGEARILFADTEDTKTGARARIRVAEGQSLGLFMVADEDTVGVEFEDFTDGGLFFGNMLAGNVSDIYDDDPATTFTPGPATIFDAIAPVVMHAQGGLLPVRALHAVGNRGEFNFLNPVAGRNAEENGAGAGVAGVTVVGFDEDLASTANYDADFDDALVAVSADTLDAGIVQTLLDGIGISRIVGTRGADSLDGTDEDDQLIGLEGRDLLRGFGGDDIIEGSDGADTAKGGAGRDEIDGEDGRDRLSGGRGADEIDGGDGDDWIHGNRGADELEGDVGNDVLAGGRGNDRAHGGDGDDTVRGGLGDDILAGGQGDDLLAGGGGADTFIYNLTQLGRDTIRGFEVGVDVIEIAEYLDVESFDDLQIEAAGANTLIDLAEGSILLQGVDAGTLGADSFLFV